MQTQTIVFLGPQGSGKGTQVANLVTYLKEQDPASKIIHLQTGAGFRALKNSNTFMARRITEIIESGQLVPDFLTTAVVVNELKDALEPDTHLLLDGFPRNLHQAEFLDELLKFYEREHLDIIYLNTPEEVIRKRMLGRGRSDDTEESINKRLSLYRQQTEPVLDYYRKRANTDFVTIDGTRTIDEVQNEIRAGLGLSNLS